MRHLRLRYLLPLLICVIGVMSAIATNLVVVDGEWQWPIFGLSIALSIGLTLLRGRQPHSDASPVGLAAATARLGVEARNEWHAEAHRRGLATPDAIRLPLAYLTAPMSVSPEAIMGRPKAKLPKPKNVTEIDDLYRALPSHRLIVVGGPEAGKTAALAIIASRQSPDGKALVPFSLAGWDPHGQPLDTWLAENLAGLYPHLLTLDVAYRLIDDGDVVPLLDGLDELPSGSQVKAVKYLDNDVWNKPFVLTSTKDAYAAVIAALSAPLPQTAVVELGPVTTMLAQRYLAASRFVDASQWKRVAPLLSTPLMVYLARKIYDRPGQKPDALLRLHDQQAVEQHLLRDYLAAAYRNDGPRPRRLRGRYTAANADAWLGYLARLLHRTGSTDIAWWRLEAITATGVRMWTAVAAFAVVTGVVPVLLLGDLLGHTGSALVLGVGGLLGAGAGLQTMDVGSAQPSGVPPGHWARDLGATARRWGLGLYMLVAIGFGIALFRVVGAPTPLSNAELRSFAAYPLVAVLIGSWVFGLDPVLDRLRRPFDGRRSRAGSVRLLAIDRWTTVADALVVTCMSGALVGALAAALAGVTAGPPATGSGFLRGWLVGLGYGTTYALFGRAWGRWLIYARLPMLLGRRHPVRLLTFWEDAHRRGVLRQAGAVYQFRHAHLLEHLATQPSAMDRGQRSGDVRADSTL
jgi:hypothetical protein